MSSKSSVRIPVGEIATPPSIPQQYNLGVVIGQTLSHNKILEKLCEGGERFVMVPRRTGGPRSIVVVDNWLAEFRRTL